jgi:hypothetical protein
MQLQDQLMMSAIRIAIGYLHVEELADLCAVENKDSLQENDGWTSALFWVLLV